MILLMKQYLHKLSEDFWETVSFAIKITGYYMSTCEGGQSFSSLFAPYSRTLFGVDWIAGSTQALQGPGLSG